MSVSHRTFNFLVVGAGINGLSTAYHLSRMGATRIGLLERFSAGHDRGSSHGFSRVTRSAYVDPRYVRLMKVAHSQEWPRLETDASEQLIFPTPGCFFGPPDGKYETYAAAVAAVGVDVEPLSPADARRTFPQFHFEGAAGALHDRTAGLVAAARSIRSLRRFLDRAGVAVHDQTRVLSLDPDVTPARVETDRGRYTADRIVITAGAWVRDLVPALHNRVSVARQTVGYFRLQGPAAIYRVGRFPVWGYLADGHDMTHYGLPEFGRQGIKVARHITGGVDDDPDGILEGPQKDAILDLRSFISAQFRAPVESFLGAESCLYTNTKTEDFILDLHPDNPSIVIGSGFTGHGFKFGPLTGRILAGLARDGKSDVAEFEAARDLFRI